MRDSIALTSADRVNQNIPQNVTMKPMPLFVVMVALVLGLTGMGEGRFVPSFSEQELLVKSELAVVATPTANHDTTERISPFMGYDRMGEAIGIETTFMIAQILKGHLENKTLVFHHYRGSVAALPNGPCFVAFDPGVRRSIRLYLIREVDGRYAAVTGQRDPLFSVCDASKKPEIRPGRSVGGIRECERMPGIFILFRKAKKATLRL